MDTTPTDFSHLFEQLGLDSSEAAIGRFIDSHRLLSGQAIWQASFWNAAQAEFLREALESDDNWSELVDALTARLRS
ncbi:DUF2789 family protein [Shewanella sp. JM162201]|uniref:DUF2789 family protein n=1 Tax=Shewanella jiangmenensis TaxID=2837387 RepID=A0ABS5V2S0_9GAMM|nr:DUF2789 domain-containing protein [Shewanella jiangmenensis]MBT1444747.1 DUF2789 family protein [Shewanella jiangmenensis]